MSNDTTAAKSAFTGPKADNIRLLRSLGYTLIPLNGKTPISTDWPSSGPNTFSEEELNRGNYGVALKPGDLVLDVDPRHYAPDDKPLARLAKDSGCNLQTFSVKTGGGGFHVYFQKPPDVLVRYSLKDYPGIDCRTVGQQVVGPGCIHPETGRAYEIIVAGPINPAPEGLLNLIKKTAVPFSEISNGRKGKAVDYKNDADTQGRFVAYLKSSAPVSGSYLVACHGRDLGLPPALTLELMLEYWNPRRSVARTSTELEAKVTHAYKYAKAPVGNKHPSADFDTLLTAKPNEEAEEKETAISWETDKSGNLKKSFYNLLNYLNLPECGLYKIFGLNQFTGMVEFINPAPWHKGRMPHSSAVTDDDLKLLKGYLAVKHGYESRVNEIEEAVTNVGHKNKFHPVREYLESLKWDGVPRLDTWLHDYAGVKDDNYSRAVSRKVLCAAVMRVLKPGVKFDHVLILEGIQNAGKSMLCEALGWKWSGDFPVDPSNKDTIAYMSGKWIVELAEMSILNSSRVDRASLKAFITRKVDKVRPAFGRLAKEFPRQCIFIGTINPDADNTYLEDSTGNRRFWPVEVGAKLNFKGVAEVRNQLYAEAMARAKQGEPLYMETDELEAEARAVVALRHADHPWTERVAAWLGEPEPLSGMLRDFVTTREVWIDGLGGLDKALGRREVVAVANILRAAGWTGSVRWVGGRCVRGYEKIVDVKAAYPTLDGLI